MIQRLCNLSISNSFFLFGPRATGKTTLIGASFEPSRVHVVDLLNSELHDSLVQQPSKLKEIISGLNSGIRVIVLDEVQRAPVLLDVIQSIMSSGNQFQFVLTGSSARKLKRGSANLLGGRAFVRHLWPFTLMELSRHLDDSFFNEQLNNCCMYKMIWGGLPLVYFADSDSSRKELLRSYVVTYLSEEVVAEQLVRNLLPFRKFLSVAAQMSGKIINYSKIAAAVGSSHVSVQNYFEILEDTLIGFRLSAYETSVRKRLRNKCKFYLFDTGVTRAMAKNIESVVVPGTSYFGELFEQMLIVEFKALCDYLKPDWTLHYLQTTHGVEIDLVIDTGVSEPILVEIKSSDKIGTVDLAGTVQLMNEFPKSRKYILSRDAMDRKIEGDISVLHWYRGIREIFEI